MRWIGCLLVGILTLAACSPAPEPAHLHQIYQRDSIRIGILNGPTSYFVTADGPTGYEYELALALAQKLGVKLDLGTKLSTGRIVTKAQCRSSGRDCRGLDSVGKSAPAIPVSTSVSVER